MTNLIERMINSNLKPCPCCGGRAAVIGTDQFVMCVKCKLKAPSIEVWNTRTQAQEIVLDAASLSSAFYLSDTFNMQGGTYKRERTCHIDMPTPGWWECDSCGAGIDWDSMDENDPPDCSYCPNCGAKVVE